MNETFTTNIKTYFGGKGSSGVPQKLINKIPPHETLLVGFLGDCSVTKHIRKAKRTIAFELDISVIRAWSHNKGIDLIHDSFLTAGIQYLYDASVFAFLDPPYLMETRLKQSPTYKYEMTKIQHLDLLMKIKNVPANVGICTYPNTLYERELKGWNIFEYHSRDRQNNQRTEWFMMNYDEPEELHDYSYLGDDYVQRGELKKKRLNMIRKFERMPELQRKMMFQALEDRFVSDKI
jgi:hypothetical protein